MSSPREIHKSFSDMDIKNQQLELKVGILSTVNPDGLPHLTMVSTLQACSPTQLVWGQFTEGLSKEFIRENPKVGFLVMTLDKIVWRGKATFTHAEHSGPEYDWYNNLPMFRYNAYFGVHTVYYMDLLEHYGMQPLPMSSIVSAAIKTMIARNISRGGGEKQVLNLWTRQLFNKLDNLKFIAFIDDNGYPLIIPVIQAQARNQEQILFSTSAFGKELDSIPQGSTVAMFGLSLAMEDVLLRGQYLGVRRVGGIKSGVVQIQWVYNSMPPTPGQIYPEVELKPIKFFLTYGPD
jgi:hypothetical protein